MKVPGKTMPEKAKDTRGTQMETGMKVTFTREKLTAKVSTTGLMEKNTMASGSMELRMATECGEAYSETATLASGKTVRLMVTGCISGRMGIAMRAVGSIASSMAEELISSPTEISTQATTNTVKLTAKASINGRMAVFIKASLKRA